MSSERENTKIRERRREEKRKEEGKRARDTFGDVGQEIPGRCRVSHLLQLYMRYYSLTSSFLRLSTRDFTFIRHKYRKRLRKILAFQFCTVSRSSNNNFRLHG